MCACNNISNNAQICKLCIAVKDNYEYDLQYLAYKIIGRYYCFYKTNLFVNYVHRLAIIVNFVNKRK